MLALGDFHYGAIWEVKGLRGEILNAYSPEVFEQRMASLLNQARAILVREGVAHVDLFLCGDSLDGMLRASQ